MAINTSDSDEALTIPQIGDASNAGVTGQVDIGNTTATASVSMRDAIYNFGSGAVTINAKASGTGTTFSKTNSVAVDLAGGAFTINNKVVITGGAGGDTLDINSAGGDITITGNIIGTDGDEILILDDNSGGSSTAEITLGGTVGASDFIKTVNLIAKGGIKLSGDITTANTAGGNVTITGPVTLVEDVIIDASANNTTVSFGSTSTVNSDSTTGGHALTIKTGTATTGAVAMQAAIGNATPLKSLSINNTGTPAGAIELVGIGNSTGPVYGVIGATAIGNGSTGSITLDGTVYTTGGTFDLTTDTGDKILVTNASGATITTSDDNITFTGGNVKISEGVASLTMTTGSGTDDGNIAIAGSIIGTDTSTGAGNTTNLSLTSGAGTIDIHAINTDIEDVTISGNTTLGGTITLTNSGVFDLTGDVLVDIATLEINSSAGGGGNVTISGALASKTAAGKNVDILTGAGLTTIGGNIGTGANAVSYTHLTLPTSDLV